MQPIHGAAEEDSLPETIDHFRIIKQVGAGTFGRVLLARDTLLDRDVVLKIPRSNAFVDQATVDAFIDEARKVAALEHPAIVRIYQIGTSSLGPFIVQPYISGGDLRQALSQPFSFKRSAEIIAKIASTIAYAHQRRIIHRDLKPANILIDQDGNPLVADFGLAIHESQQPQSRGMIAGTWPYMSPEQIRGESHRLDGRSDIWSLGVIFYQMLVGKLPYPHKDYQDLREAICHQSPRPPRQLDITIPSELERICLRCLSIKMAHRYGTAADLSAELLEWIESQHVNVTAAERPKAESKANASSYLEAETTSTVQEIIPKGLLAFDEDDHLFFEWLLPGPRTRDRTPEQLRFWVSKIDCDTSKSTFSVGLIYGPSGCGKSSFVRAGLLPKLPVRIRKVFIEAADTETSVRLAIAIRKAFPTLSTQLTLVEMLAEIRTGKGLGSDEKLLIVIDQFEQWLNSQEARGQEGMIEAMRQCDGERVQSIVLVRDDFWMGVSRFFQELEIPLAERDNFHALHLFDITHATNVLAAFGRAYNKLPAIEALNSEQQKFLDEAIKRLTVGGKVICIHLVLLAETLRNKPWVIGSLEKGGQLQHIGRDFLNQQLSATSANPNHRFYQMHIREVLRSLLPRAGTDIKARFRSQSELARAARLPEQSKQFATIIDILDKQLRLISAVDPDGVQEAGDSSVITVATLATRPRYYQLTHDFLVPSVRAWLDDNDRQTAAGRARLRLQSLAASYAQTNDKRFLPVFLEFLQILKHVKWSDCDHAMKIVYGQALKRYGVLSLTFMLLIAGSLGYAWASRIQEFSRRADEWGRTWTTAQASALPSVLEIVERDKTLMITALRRKLRNTSEPEELHRLHLGLLLLGNPDRQSCQVVVDTISDAGIDELPLIRQALQADSPTALKEINRTLSQQLRDEAVVKLSLVALHLGETQPLMNCLMVVRDKFRHLAAVHLIGQDRDSLNPYLHLITQKESEHIGSLAEVVKGLALRDWSKDNAQDRKKYEDCLQILFETSPNAAVHSAAQFALGKLGIAPITVTAPSGSMWFQLERWLTFARIQGAGKQAGLKIMTLNSDSKLAQLEIEGATDYWLSTTEVPSSLFNEFASEPEFLERWNKKWNPGVGDQPAVRLRPDQAMHFCNWLSKKFGRRPFYIETDENLDKNLISLAPSKLSVDAFMLARRWKIDQSANGFRIPTNFELFYAAAGESKSVLPEDDLEMARTYANEQFWFADNSNNAPLKLHPCATKPPNSYGVFDAVGNAAELTIQPQDGIVPNRLLVVLMSVEASLQNLQEPPAFNVGLWVDGPTTGFRLACDDRQ